MTPERIRNVKQSIFDLCVALQPPNDPWQFELIDNLALFYEVLTFGQIMPTNEIRSVEG